MNKNENYTSKCKFIEYKSRHYCILKHKPFKLILFQDTNETAYILMINEYFIISLAI